jgi:uncharacterized peroxidase-related enzyme
MGEIAANGLRMIEEDEATGEVAALYEEIKREMMLPVVPNFMKVLAVSPAALAIQWKSMRALYEHSTLPASLTSMIFYAIAEQNECQYCSASHELTCRTLGIDEETLHKLINDLPHLTPERIRATIQFALKLARAPKSLVRADYDNLRAYGVGDDEIVEIIQIASLGGSGDVLADGLKVDVDTHVLEGLAELAA